MEEEFTFGQIADAMKDFGRTIKCMEMECSHGQTEENMKENIMMTKSKVEVSLPGLMVECIMEIGIMASSMELVSITLLRVK